METHKLDNWATLYSKYSLSVQRAKLIIIISFLFVAFPSSISYAKNKRKIEKVSVSSTQTLSMLYALDSVPLPHLEAEQPSDILSNVGQTGDGIAALPANDIESIYVLSIAAWKPSNQWINSNLLNKSAWK